MLLGLVKQSSGQAFVLGAPSSDVEVRRKIGFLPEDFRFYSWLTAAELLQLHGRLFGMAAARLRERVSELLELVGLTPHREKRLRDFSKGMLQRIGLAQALIHGPELVFLDEPTSGLDPMGRRLVRDIIHAERERGATIFLNSHILSEIEITCDRVVFIKDGRVVASRDLRANPEGEVRLAARVRNLSAQGVVELARWGSAVKIDGERLTMVPRSPDVLPEILRELVSAGADVFEYRPEHLSLEDLFLKTMGEDRGL